MKTIAEARKQLTAALNSIYDSNESHAIARVIFEDLLGYNNSLFILHSNEWISKDEQQMLDNALPRLLSKEPVQYITGKAHFLEHIYYVNSHVLIPRPETEELVLHIFNYIKNHNIKNPIIVDICTGSGCIAIAIKSLVPDAEIYAIDISNEALLIANKNAESILGKDYIHFMQKDVLNIESLEDIKQIDIIVSNPPYVLNSEKASMHKNVLDFEPHLALFVLDEDALIFYRKIGELGIKSIAYKGQIFFEINEQKAAELVHIFNSMGYNNAKTIKDIFEKDRMMQISQ